MRALAILVLLAGFALPVSAGECLTVDIGQVDGSPYVTAVESGGGVRYAVVGLFLWLDFGAGIVSFDVSDVSQAVACADGTVQLVHSEPDVEPDVVQPEPEPDRVLSIPRTVRPDGWTIGIYPA